MPQADVFPIDPDWPVSRSRESNVLSHRAASGEEYQRMAAPERRIFTLTFQRRPRAHWDAIENFHLAHLDDYFTFVDLTKGAGRDYTVRFLAPPVFDEAWNEQVNISVQLIEMVNKPLRNYPTTPLLERPLSTGQAVTGGTMFVYSGYGYKLSGSFTSVELDGVALGATAQKFDVPLGLHKLKVTPNAGGLTKVEFVH